MKEDLIRNAIATRDPGEAEKAFCHIDELCRLSLGPKERANLLLGKSVLLGVLHRFEEAREQLRLAQAQASDDSEISLQSDFISASFLMKRTILQKLSRDSQLCCPITLRGLKNRICGSCTKTSSNGEGFNLARLERFEDAIPVLNECLSFQLDQQTRSNILANIGLCDLELKRYESAAAEFEETIAVGVSKSWRQSIHFYLGITYSQLARFQEALSEFLT